jgi:hypothetical protein
MHQDRNALLRRKREGATLGSFELAFPLHHGFLTPRSLHKVLNMPQPACTVNFQLHRQKSSASDRTSLCSEFPIPPALRTLKRSPPPRFPSLTPLPSPSTKIRRFVSCLFGPSVLATEMTGTGSSHTTPSSNTLRPVLFIRQQCKTRMLIGHPMLFLSFVPASPLDVACLSRTLVYIVSHWRGEVQWHKVMRDTCASDHPGSTYCAVVMIVSATTS